MSEKDWVSVAKDLIDQVASELTTATHLMLRSRVAEGLRDAHAEGMGRTQASILVNGPQEQIAAVQLHLQWGTGEKAMRRVLTLDPKTFVYELELDLTRVEDAHQVEREQGQISFQGTVVACCTEPQPK